MKVKILIAMIAVVLCSCHGDKIKSPKISNKYYTNFWGNPMPSGICRFCYEYDGDGCVECTQDSCDLYKVGDSINF